MVSRDSLAKRAMEIYLQSNCSMAVAYEKAKCEVLKDNIPEEVRRVFGVL